MRSLGQRHLVGDVDRIAPKLYRLDFVKLPAAQRFISCMQCTICLICGSAGCIVFSPSNDRNGNCCGLSWTLFACAMVVFFAHKSRIAAGMVDGSSITFSMISCHVPDAL